MSTAKQGKFTNNIARELNLTPEKAELVACILNRTSKEVMIFASYADAVHHLSVDPIHTFAGHLGTMVERFGDEIQDYDVYVMGRVLDYGRRSKFSS
jgi:hypothetical protein